MVRNTMDRYFIFQLAFFLKLLEISNIAKLTLCVPYFLFLSFGKLWQHFLMNFKTALLQSDRNVVLFKNFVQKTCLCTSFFYFKNKNLNFFGKLYFVNFIYYNRKKIIWNNDFNPKLQFWVNKYFRNKAWKVKDMKWKSLTLFLE